MQMTGMIDPPLDVIATPDVLTMITRIDSGSVIPSPTPVTIDIGVAAIMTPIEATPGHSTDLPNVVSLATEAQVPTTIAATHHTADLHLIGIQQVSTQFPKTTLQTGTRILVHLTSNTLEA